MSSHLAWMVVIPLAGAVLATAATSRLVAMRIRVQGIRLWLRRLPIVPRTHALSKETAA